MPTSATVLVTAFEPFGGETVNASELAARPLDGRVVLGHRIEVVILPCVFGAAIEALREALRRTSPRLVVACGEAGDRKAISLERIAINVDDARIPDNAGQRPVDRPIVPGDPAGRWSTLPLRAMGRAVFEAGIPVELSNSAGTFVCNHVFYELMRALEGTGVRGGFVHVPRPSALPTETTTRALALAIEAALQAPM